MHFPDFHLYKRGDGIVVLTSEDSAWITVEKAKRFVIAIHEITGGIPHGLLFIPGRHTSIDKEARTYMASEEALRDITARAGIPKNVAHQIIGGLHITQDRPVKPIRQFDNISDAISWLKKQKV